MPGIPLPSACWNRRVGCTRRTNPPEGQNPIEHETDERNTASPDNAPRRDGSDAVDKKAD